MVYLLKMVIFHGYVKEPHGNILMGGKPSVSLYIYMYVFYDIANINSVHSRTSALRPGSEMVEGQRSAQCGKSWHLARWWSSIVPLDQWESVNSW